jgi:dynein heavy chain
LFIKIKHILNRLGKERVNELLIEAQKSIDYLSVYPVTTEEYVQYIKFIDRAPKKVDKMETQLDYVKELYDIIEEYKISISAEDTANYMVIYF